MTNYNKKIKNKKVDHVTADRRSIYHQHHQGHPHHSASPLHVIITVIIIPLDSLQKHSSCHHRGWVNTYAYTSLEIIGPLLADEHPTIWCRARGSGTLNAHPTLVSVFPRTRASSAGTSWDHVHSPPVTKGSLRDWTADPFPINPPMGWKLLKNWHHLLYIVFFFFYIVKIIIQIYSTILAQYIPRHPKAELSANWTPCRLRGRETEPAQFSDVIVVPLLQVFDGLFGLTSLIQTW